MAELTITERTVEGVAIVDLTGEVDSYNAPKLRDFLSEKITHRSPSALLNLSDVVYIDSVGLGMLVSVLKQAQGLGGSLQLICPGEAIFRMFTITGLVRVFTIYANEAQALSIMAGPNTA